MEKYSVTATNVGPTLFCMDARGHRTYCEIPEAHGGTDNAMTPPEMLLAAEAGCLGAVIAIVCRNKGVPYEGLEVTVEADGVDGGKRMDNFVVKVKMPNADDPTTRRIVEAALPLCKVGETLMKGAEVTYEVVPAE